MCFWKTLHLILMHFIYIFQCLEEFLHKTGLFFKTVFIFYLFYFILFYFFSEFRSIEAVFRSIEIVLKILREPLSISINQKMWIRFFKNRVWLVQTHFSKVFQTFLSLSDLAKAHPQFFVVFLRSFCKVFLSPSR